MREHTVRSFDEDLDRIDNLVKDMSNSARSMVGSSVRALLSADLSASEGVVLEDIIMDTRQRELDDHAIRLIARRQPMAQDLRAVIGAIRIAGDLERIGDLAKNIAKRSRVLQKVSLPHHLVSDIDEMTNLVLHQISGVMDQYVLRDAAGLGFLRSNDEKIDFLYTSFFNQILDCMMKEREKTPVCIHILFCAKNLERIGDHITNIAENVYFVVTGERLSLARPKHDPILPIISM